MTDRVRFPGYSTLDKRDSPSWNEATRFVVQKRLYNPPQRRFFTDEEWPILIAVCDRIIPQTGERVPIENFVDQKMMENQGDGYQKAGEPSMQEMWRRGLRALEQEARLRFGEGFADLPGGRQDDVLHMVQRGDVRAPEWAEVSAESFFTGRVLRDVITYYYAHPKGWDEIGFGGPASPRGYVRMGFDRHDPWDAVPAKEDRPHA